MSEEELIITIYCIVDDILEEHGLSNLRRKGVSPKLSDSEVITMELMGEYLGEDEDKGIWSYFRRHWRKLFPKIGCRTTFVRQSANLWYVKQLVQQQLSINLGTYSDDIHIVDGFPLPVCSFPRASRCKLFQEQADYGYCASKKQTYYGFQGLINISFDGVITGISLAAANIDERDVIWDITQGIQGLLIGDKGFIRPILNQQLLTDGIDLQTPLRKNMIDQRPKSFVKQIISKRRLVETVIGQLAGRFNIEHTKARDIWHLTNRIYRKILSHTICVFINKALGNPPLQLALLLKS